MIYSDGNNVIIISNSNQIRNLMSALIQGVVSIKNDNVSSNEKARNAAEYYLANFLLELNNPTIDLEVINKIRNIFVPNSTEKEELNIENEIYPEILKDNFFEDIESENEEEITIDEE